MSLIMRPMSIFIKEDLKNSEIGTANDLFKQIAILDEKKQEILSMLNNLKENQAEFASPISKCLGIRQEEFSQEATQRYKRPRIQKNWSNFLRNDLFSSKTCRKNLLDTFSAGSNVSSFHKRPSHLYQTLSKYLFLEKSDSSSVFSTKENEKQVLQPLHLKNSYSEDHFNFKQEKKKLINKNTSHLKTDHPNKYYGEDRQDKIYAFSKKITELMTEFNELRNLDPEQNYSFSGDSNTVDGNCLINKSNQKPKFIDCSPAASTVKRPSISQLDETTEKQLDVISDSQTTGEWNSEGDALSDTWENSISVKAKESLSRKIIQKLHDRKNVKRSRFSSFEDEVIVNKIQAYGLKWDMISKNLPGRTPNMVKNRYYSSLKKKFFMRNSLPAQFGDELDLEYSYDKLVEERNIKEKDFCEDHFYGGNSSMIEIDHQKSLQNNEFYPDGERDAEEESANQALEDNLLKSPSHRPILNVDFDWETNDNDFFDIQNPLLVDLDNQESSSQIDNTQEKIQQLFGQIKNIEDWLEVTRREIQNLGEDELL